MFRTRGIMILLGLLACGAGPLSAFAEWTTHVYGSHAQAATLDTSDVQESSGVVAGRVSPDVFWTNNDSGAGPRVYAFRMSSADVAAGIAVSRGYVNLAGAASVDWEDISAGPDGTIYVFDGGDNPPCNRTDKRVYRFVEPVVEPDGAPMATDVAYESIRFEYPDSANPASPADADSERYDAESLFVHFATGDMYLVTKRSNDNTYTARVYKLPASAVTWNAATVHVLQFVADISARVPSMTTAADLDADGRRALIRNYATAYEFVLPAGRPFDEIFQQTPQAISMLGEIQGEGICYAAAGGDIITTSEVQIIGPVRMPVFRTPWRLANVRAEDVRMNRATIKWDTAEALGSNVNYGHTVAYGSTVNDPTPATSHAVLLSGLSRGIRHYYRVASGTLSYPPTAAAESVYFTTPDHIAPDFDADGDVDLEDFAHLQVCFTGPSIHQTDPACLDARLDADEDVDATDFVRLHMCMSGAGVLADPDCEP